MEEHQGRSYYHSASDIPLLNHSCSEMFDKSCDQHPDKDVLVFYTKDGIRQAITYSKLQTDSKSLALALVHLGCKTGDHIAMMMENSLEFYTVQLALHRIGATICMFVKNTEVASALIAKMNCVTLFLDFGTHLTSEERTWIKMMIPKFKITITLNDYSLPHVTLLSDIITMGKAMDYKSFPPIRTEADTLAVVLFTSGSSGLPKGVQFTYHRLINTSRIIADRIGLNRNSILFNDRPMAYGVGMCMGAVLAFLGTTIVSLPSDINATNKDTYADMLIGVLYKEAVTYAVLFQYQMYDLARYPGLAKDKLQLLQYIVTGGQQAPQELLARVSEILPKASILHCYGATEAAVSCHSPRDVTQPGYLKSTGRPFDHVEVKIVNEDGEIVPFDEPGEILTRGFQTFSGYHGDELATREVLTRDGWYQLGDTGFLTKDGYLTVIGRMANVLKVGTIKVYTTEVEAVLRQHPSISQVAVVGVPDVVLGQVVCACVTTKEDEQEESLLEWCSQKFPVGYHGYSSGPKHIIIMKELPLVETGKVNLTLLQTLAAKTLHLRKDA